VGDNGGVTTVLGIDIGGTGIKGAPVDTETGRLTADRHRIPTPHPATPPAVAEVVGEIAKFFEWRGPVGATFPAVIKAGVACSAANVDKSWIGTDASRLFSDAIGSPVTVVNDADAAGIAEMRFGAGRGEAGVVLLVTIGTGIGTALFLDGTLVPNTELGHVEIKGVEAEHRAAESVRESEGLSWKAWSKRLDQYFEMLHRVLWPDLYIVGGGISKKSDKFVPRLSTGTRVVPAQLLNNAGIVGAALAHEQFAAAPTPTAAAGATAAAT
jgi:polyphosphate glucokinase